MSQENIAREGIEVVIGGYTRAQAIEDGVLVDLTPWAKEIGVGTDIYCGFKFPVAITRAAWSDFIELPESHLTASDKRRSYGQSERGRAHDVLMVLLFAIRASLRASQGPISQLNFTMSRIPYQGDRHPQPRCLKAICGPGDTPEPVITIMLPEED
jgi:hypothetical protein